MTRAGLLAVAATVALGTAAAQPASAEIKVGITVPATGSGAAFGVPMMQEVAALPRTIAGQAVTYIALDSKTDPTTAAANARKLVTQDKVDLLVGEGTTPSTFAMIDIAADSKTPLIAPAATSSFVEPLDAKRRWVFKVVPNDDIGAATAIAHMKKTGIKSVALISFNDAYGQSWLELFKKMLPEAGIKMTAAEFFNRTDTSVTAQALKMLATHPDAIFDAAGGTPGIVPAHDVRARGFKGQIYMTHGVSSRAVIERGGKDVEGAVFAGEPFTIYKDLPADNPFRKVAEETVDSYKKTNGGAEPPIFAGNIRDAILMLEAAAPEALKKAKPGTEEFRTALRDGLENVKDLYLNNGMLSNSPTNHAGFSTKGSFMIKIAGGDFHLIQ